VIVDYHSQTGEALHALDAIVNPGLTTRQQWEINLREFLNRIQRDQYKEP
jgi:hypothetical protein